MKTEIMRTINRAFIWTLNKLSIVGMLSSIVLMDLKGALISLALGTYFWFLWQLDHSIAPIVWRYKDEIYLDGWLIEDFLNWLGKKYFDNPNMGTNFFEITSVYNTLMVGLILLPIIIAILGFL